MLRKTGSETSSIIWHPCNENSLRYNTSLTH